MPIATRHGFEKNALSIFMTVAVVGLLLAAGPAGAIEIKINGLSGAHKLGKQIKFMFDVRINHGDTMGELLTNEKFANITFTNYPYGWSESCKVYANKTTDCDFLSVDKIKVTGDDNYGYGYGYGYDGETKHSLGYGYGYGYGDKNTHIMYTLSVDSKILGAGAYSATIDIHAGSPVEHTFSAEKPAIFYIVAKGSSSHDKVDETEVEDHDVDAFDTAKARIFVKTNKPVKGTISVTGFEENPVWNVKGLTGLLHAKKYLDITADEGILGSLDHAIIKIYYNKKDIKHIDESTLAIYYWNDEKETWEYVGDHVGEDANGKYIYVTVEHFSIYALFGSPPVVTQPAVVNSVSTGSVQHPGVSATPTSSSVDQDEPTPVVVPKKVKEDEPVVDETEEEPVLAKKNEKAATPTGQVASVAFPSGAILIISSLMLFIVGYSNRMTSSVRTHASFQKAFGSIFPAKKRVVKASSNRMVLENLSGSILGKVSSKNTPAKISPKKKVAKAPSKKTVIKSSAKKRVVKASSKKAVAKKTTRRK